jgi:hypothetical protein
MIAPVSEPNLFCKLIGLVVSGTTGEKRRQSDVFNHGQGGDEAEVLENETQLIASKSGPLSVVQFLG